MQDTGLPLLHALHVHSYFIETAVALLPLFLPFGVYFLFFLSRCASYLHIVAVFPLRFYLFYIMLTVRSCNDCGRRVRLSSSIQPPKCPACRLPDLRPITDTRTCLRCQVLIPTEAPNPLCVNCQYARYFDPLSSSGSLPPRSTPSSDCCSSLSHFGLVLAVFMLTYWLFPL
jgi:hypothetical protein